jgi:isopentenyl-diphosphate delta-isomerase
MANVGAAQLVAQRGESPLTPGDVARLAEMIGADAVIVHLNALQELIQPEGDRNGAGWLEAIGGLVRELSVPVVAKETGGGLSEADARRTAEAGVAAIDVGGRGGTSFAAIEGMRAADRGDARGVALAGIFGEWGIPTAASVVVASRAGVPVIATGGVRSGLDAARALALGAVAVGVARPLLQAARSGDDEVAAWIERFRDGLLGAMFLTGSATAGDLRRAPYVLGGETESWVRGLG